MSKQNTVERKVYFYRVNPAISNTDFQFDPHGLCNLIANLKFESGDRYHYFKDGGSLAVWPKRTEQKSRLILAGLRTTGLPELEDTGKFKKLEVTEKEKVAEKTHLIFFSDRIIGAEFNFYGPRVSRLAYYLKAKELADVSIDPIISRDFERLLANITEVKAIELRVKRDAVELLKEAQASLFGAVRSISEQANAPIIDVVLRQERRTDKGHLASMYDFVKSLVGHSEVRQGVEKFRIQARNEEGNGFQWFDLLEDRFVSARKVAREGSKHRVVDSESMFTEIEAAYEDLREQLREAPSLGG